MAHKHKVRITAIDGYIKMDIDKAFYGMQGFAKSAKVPSRSGLHSLREGQSVKYRELWEFASRIAATMQAHPEFSQVPLSAVFGYRSVTAFAGVLGALLAGNGYVPLNRTFPSERTELMFERSGCRSISVDAGSSPSISETVLDRAGQPLLS